MIYLLLCLVLASCDAMFQARRTNRILIQRINPNAQSNQFLSSNQQTCGQANFVSNVPLTPGFIQRRNGLNSLPLSAKYTSPVIDYMGKPIVSRESKSLKNGNSFQTRQFSSKQFPMFSQNLSLQRSNDIVTMTNRLKALSSTRNTFIPFGTRNAGINFCIF